MKMEHHIAVSVPVSLSIWALTGSVWYFLMSLALGFLVDADHVLDYVREEKKFDMKDMFVKSYKGDFKKLYLIFHCFEFVPLVWLAGFFTGSFEFSAVFTIAYLSHMVPDQISNNTKPWGYFFFYRMANKFKMRKIFYVPRGGIHKV
ncbi:MAG TPA: hypothetical protein ENN43_06210 [bacterium]|nr:hypothetical protein [bacterium]